MMETTNDARPTDVRERIENHCERTSSTANDGFTLNADLSECDQTGYVATITCEEFSKDQGITADDVLEMYVRYAEVFCRYADAAKLGGFSAGEGDDYISIDINILVGDQDLAEDVGARFNQKAIWDIEGGRPIDTGGTGEPVVETVEDVLEALDEIEF